MKSGSLNLLEPSGPHRACYRTPLSSSYINIPLPAFLEVFEADLESTFWEVIEPSEWPECQQNADLICVYKDMKCQATKETNFLSMVSIRH
jgi:hypothetical protein